MEANDGIVYELKDDADSQFSFLCKIANIEPGEDVTLGYAPTPCYSKIYTLVSEVDGSIYQFDDACETMYLRPYGEMTEKEKILSMYKKDKPTTERNSMGCDESWYDCYYAISQTFQEYEIEYMDDDEISDLVKLANKISEVLY